MMLVACGFMTAGMSAVKVLTHTGWPELIMQSIGYACSSIMIGAYLLVRGPCRPPKGELRWVIRAGGFMSLSTVLLIVCMAVGTPIGDVSSLVSINVVMAALLGRVFLGERLQWTHLVSALCSITGALLIASPQALFGGAPVRSSAATSAGTGVGTIWVGYVLAPIAGVLDACVLISARKCPGASEWHIALSYYSQACLVLTTLAFAPGLMPHQESPAKLAAAPGETVAWLALLTAVDLPSMLLFTAGAMSLPAAVSATVDTGGRIVLGFLADVLFFHSTVEPLTAAGATLMLLSVTSMAMLRQQPSQASPGSDDVEQTARGASADDQPGAAREQEEEVEDISSVASFAATEFVDVDPRSRDVRAVVQQLRSRLQRQRPKSAVAPQVVGTVNLASS